MDRRRWARHADVAPFKGAHHGSSRLDHARSGGRRSPLDAGDRVIAMTAFPPEDRPPIQSSAPAEPRTTRRRQAAVVAILLLIAIAVVLVLLL